MVGTLARDNARLHDISIVGYFHDTLIVDFSHSRRSVFSVHEKRIGNFEKRAAERVCARVNAFVRGANSKFEALGREEDARRQAVCSYSVSDL